MRTGLTISSCVHVAIGVLGLLMMWGVISFTKPLPPQIDAVAVDTISEDDLTHMMQGVRQAPKAEAPKPLVDKIGEPSPIKDPTPKVSEKPEIKATSDEPPAPEPPKPEPKPEPPKQAKAEPAPPKAEPVPPKPDPIAEALKRDEAKKKEDAKKEEARKKEEAKKKAEAKKKEEERKKLEAKKREQEKFNTASIESRLALLDKRAPQRNATTGATLNQTANLGTRTGASMTLSASEIDALRSRLAECWDVPVGVRDARDLVVTVHILFKRDGSLASEPVVTNHSVAPVFQVAAESALRAVRKCAPYSFLPPAKYAVWSDVTVDFNPLEMFGG